jgi:hypothetical protein
LSHIVVKRAVTHVDYWMSQLSTPVGDPSPGPQANITVEDPSRRPRSETSMENPLDMCIFQR